METADVATAMSPPHLSPLELPVPAATPSPPLLAPVMRRTRSLEGFGTSPRSTLRSSQPMDLAQSPPTTSRSVGTNPPSPLQHRNSDLTLDAQRFERMMERFQLRRLPSAAPIPLIQIRRNSMDVSRRNSRDLNTMMSSRRNSRRSSFFTSGAAGHVSHESADSSSSRKSLVRKAHEYWQDLASAVADAVWWMKLTLSTTTETVSIATRVRLAILGIVLTTKVLYMPFAIAYENHNNWAQPMDVVVDVVFFLNILATCNTVTFNAQRRVVSSRRAIWRYYRRHGFVMDLLAALPIEMVLVKATSSGWAHWIIGLIKLALQSVCVNRHLQIFHLAWSKDVISADQSAAAWMLFSRYSHLIRIGRIVLSIVLVAHYFACMWSWLHVDVDADFFETRSTITIHLDSFYEALQLLQGQGISAKTTGQAAFGSVAVLLGSILLAVMFGNVAILVSNFNANNTAYQRKMEQVFSVMGKLELPHPIRERVHQYYEYLHVEYESLDGEVVKFAKDLSHTLELEVVLFKYMDVLMQVPHWRGCSPDFQKQLVLSLNVRIYLPDDFIMRRGEVGTECYLINGGTCKLCEYPTGNYEPPTITTAPSDDFHTARRLKILSTHRSTRSMGPPRGNETEASVMKDSAYDRTSVLRRGQAICEFALLANYERSSDLRAISYVEMCVIERKTFQQLLTRYPRDREIVVTSIVRHRMLSLAAQGVPDPLMKMVKRAKADATLAEAVDQISRALNPPRDDPSILFGMSTEVFGRLKRGFAGQSSQAAQEAQSRAGEETASGPSVSNAFSRPTADGTGLERTVQELQDRLRHLEERERGADPTCDCTSHTQHALHEYVPVRRRRRNTAKPPGDSLNLTSDSFNSGNHVGDSLVAQDRKVQQRRLCRRCHEW